MENETGTIIQRDAQGNPIAAATVGKDRTADQAAAFLEVIRFVTQHPEALSGQTEKLSKVPGKTKRKK